MQRFPLHKAGLAGRPQFTFWIALLVIFAAQGLPIAGQAAPAQTKQNYTSNAPSSTKPTAKLKLPLKGGVSVDVPRTPEDVAKYLIKMRTIIHRYEAVAVGTIMQNGQVKMDMGSMNSARVQTIDLVKTINATVPPAELKREHRELANTMSAVGSFMENPGQHGGGLAAMAQLGPLFGRLSGTLNSYHSGVLVVIDGYGLDRRCDPFSGESEQTKQQLGNALDSMKSQMMRPPSAQPQTSSSGGSTSDGMAGGLGALLNSLGLGNLDLNSLGGLGNMGGLDLSSLGSLLGGGSGGSTGDLGRLGNLNLNSLGELGGMEMDTLKGLGQSGAGSSGLGSSGGFGNKPLGNSGGFGNKSLGSSGGFGSKSLRGNDSLGGLDLGSLGGASSGLGSLGGGGSGQDLQSGDLGKLLNGVDLSKLTGGGGSGQDLQSGDLGKMLNGVDLSKLLNGGDASQLLQQLQGF